VTVELSDPLEDEEDSLLVIAVPLELTDAVLLDPLVL